MAIRKSLSIGPRTKIDVLESKFVKKDKYGFDIYEDYWTDSENDSSSKCSRAELDELTALNEAFINENVKETKSDEWEVSVCVSSQKDVQVSTRSSVSINIHYAVDGQIRVTAKPADHSQNLRNSIFSKGTDIKDNSKCITCLNCQKQCETFEPLKSISPNDFRSAKSAEYVKDGLFCSNVPGHFGLRETSYKAPFMFTQKINESVSSPKNDFVPQSIENKIQIASINLFSSDDTDQAEMPKYSGTSAFSKPNFTSKENQINSLSANIPVDCDLHQEIVQTENQCQPISTVCTDENIDISSTQEQKNELLSNVPKKCGKGTYNKCAISSINLHSDHHELNMSLLGNPGYDLVEGGKNYRSPESFKSKSRYMHKIYHSTLEKDNNINSNNRVTKPSTFSDEVCPLGKAVVSQQVVDCETKGFEFDELAFNYPEVDDENQANQKFQAASHSSSRNPSEVFYERYLIVNKSSSSSDQDSIFVEGKNLNFSSYIEPASSHSACDFHSAFPSDKENGLEVISCNLEHDYRTESFKLKARQESLHRDSRGKDLAQMYQSSRKRLHSGFLKESTAAVEASEEENCRRSKRKRYPPLDHWRNQRLVYRFENGQIKCLGIDDGTPEDKSSINHLYRSSKRRMNKKPVERSRVYKMDDSNKEVSVQLAKSFSTVPWPTEYAGKPFRAKLLFKTESSYFGYIEIDGFSIKRSRCLSEYDLQLTTIRGRVEITIQSNTIKTFLRDMCFIPKGNKYCIKNLGERKALLLFSLGKFKFLESNVE